MIGLTASASTFLTTMLVLSLLLPLLAYLGATVYRRVKDSQMDVYLEEDEVEKAEDEDFFQRTQCEAKLLELLSPYSLANNEFIRGYQFRTEDFNREHLLAVLHEHNPHIIDLVINGSNMRPILGPVGVRETHEMQRREAERLAEANAMECDEWPCHKPGHEAKHKAMHAAAKDKVDLDEMIPEELRVRLPADAPVSDDLRVQVRQLENQLKEFVDDIKAEIEKLHKAAPVVQIDKVRELYRSQDHERLVRSIKVLTKILSPDHPHVIAARAEGETRLALYKAASKSTLPETAAKDLGAVLKPKKPAKTPKKTPNASKRRSRSARA